MPPRDQELAAPVDDDARADHLVRQLFLRGFHREIFRPAIGIALADVPQRTVRTIRLARRAAERAEFHHGLVELPCPAARQQVIDPGLQPPLARRAARVAAEGEHAAEHTRHVAVDDRHIEVEREAADRRRGVGPDARQREQFLIRLREFPVAVCDEPLRRLVGAPCAGVIAQPLPLLEHVLLARRGQRSQGREPLHEAQEIGARLLDARLLEHQFGDPDAVGRALRPPGHLPAMLLKPTAEFVMERAPYAGRD